MPISVIQIVHHYTWQRLVPPLARSALLVLYQGGRLPKLEMSLLPTSCIGRFGMKSRLFPPVWLHVWLLEDLLQSTCADMRRVGIQSAICKVVLRTRWDVPFEISSAPVASRQPNVDKIDKGEQCCDTSQVPYRCMNRLSLSSVQKTRHRESLPSPQTLP